MQSVPGQFPVVQSLVLTTTTMRAITKRNSSFTLTTTRNSFECDGSTLIAKDEGSEGTLVSILVFTEPDQGPRVSGHQPKSDYHCGVKRNEERMGRFTPLLKQVS